MSGREDGRVPPHNLDAEESLLGAMLLSRDAIRAAIDSAVVGSDFYKTAHGHVFDAITRLYGAGEPIDPVTVAEELTRFGVLEAMGGPAVLLHLQATTPATSNAARYARIIVVAATRRRLIGVAGEIAELGYDAGVDVAEAVDQARTLTQSVEAPIVRLPNGLMVLDDMLDRPPEQRTPWVIPGLLRRDWRVIVVAPEGGGKTEALSQTALCAAQGVHPFKLSPIPPVRVLMVDLENPEERIIDGGLPIRENVRRAVGDRYDGDRLWLWHQPGGIDLRSRSDAGSLEAVLAHVRPQLVCMGPVYKMSSRAKGEGWDEAALATQRVLDDLRYRYQFALLMEDHAPQATGGVRDLRPFGSSLWMRWPEIGLKMVPQGDAMPPASVQLARWRGDRLKNSWPAFLDRGQLWSWEGRWITNGEAAA